MCLKQDGVGRDGQVVDGEGWYIGIYPREHGSNRVEILMFSDGLLVLGSAAVALHSADQWTPRPGPRGHGQVNMC
jgi:hypothetical protein